MTDLTTTTIRTADGEVIPVGGFAYTYTEVDIDKADGNMADFVVMEKGKPETAYVLYGWDEVGLFDHEFTSPVYARMTEVK